MNLELPSSVSDDSLGFLFSQLSDVDSDELLTIDFSRVHFYQPGAVIALLTRLCHWKEQGRGLVAKGIQTCPSRRYLQRMDFFEHLGIQLEEDFERLPTRSRFVEIRSIDNLKVNEISREVADCMAAQCEEPEEVSRCFSYVLGELVANVAQHSRGQGFLSAQHYPKRRIIRVAVGDCGIGLRRSFEGTSLEAELQTPLAALEKSLEPMVSSALLRPPSGPYHQYENRGVGLSMLSEIVRETFGRFDVYSENAGFQRLGDVSAKFEEFPYHHPGTLVVLSMNTDEVSNFASIIEKVTARVEPSELDEWDQMFDGAADETGN